MARAKKAKLNDPARVILYTRVSTDHQDLSPDAQLAAAESWCAAHNATIVATFADVGLSGTVPLDRRPGLLAAIGAIGPERAGTLLCARRDRFFRDVVQAAVTEQMAEKSGARVLSADGSDAGDGPEAWLLKTIKDCFAQYEVLMIRARTAAAMAAKRARGEKTGGAVPFGFRVADDGKTLLRDEGEQAVVERIRALRADGLSLRQIAARLAEDGTDCRGGRWHPKTIANILNREAA